MNNTRKFTAEEVMTLAVTFEQQAQRADTLLANVRTQSPTAGALRSCADTVRRFVAVQTPIIVKVPQDMPIELNPETVALMLKSAAKSLPPVHALYCHRGAAVITRLLEASAAPVASTPVEPTPVVSPEAAQVRDNDDEMVTIFPGLPGLPRWLLEAAKRIERYMAQHHPGHWAIDGIQKRGDA